MVLFWQRRMPLRANCSVLVECCSGAAVWRTLQCGALVAMEAFLFHFRTLHVLVKTELSFVPPSKAKEVRARGKEASVKPLGAGQPELM